MIKLLETGDLPVFKKLRLEALHTVPEAYASRAEDWETLPEAEWLRRMTETPVFVGFRDSEPVGMMGLLPHRSSKMAHRGTIVMVYVRDNARGSGIAAQLLANLSRHAVSLGIRQLELGVNATNERAIRFYEREGFMKVGRIPDGYIHDGRGIDEVLMMRRMA